MHFRADFLGCGCTNGKPFGKVGKACFEAKSAVEGFVANGEPMPDILASYAVATTDGTSVPVT